MRAVLDALDVTLAAAEIELAHEIAVLDPAESEYRAWIERGFTPATAAWTVYMLHNELAPSWLVAHRARP